jgi:hypothetical protein
MKKLILLTLTGISASLLSQSSIKVFYQKSNISVAANSTIHASTSAGYTSKMTFDVQNISGSSKSYNVKRYDVLLHVTSNTTARANFCFAGQCYDSTTFISQIPLDLGAGERSNVVYTDTMFYSLDADLFEWVSKGLSKVKYSIVEINNPADSLQFTIVYNDPAAVGITSNNNTVSSIRIFPNPARDNATFTIMSTTAHENLITVFNTIGDLVLSKRVQLAEGRNTFNLDTQQLSKGIYIVQVRNGQEVTSKKLIVE